MNSLSVIAFLDWVVQVAPVLLAGTTILLLLGCLAVWRHRSPIHRQRLGELTIAAVFVWTGLALTPLPRPLPIDRLLPTWKTAEHAVPDPSREIVQAPAELPSRLLASVQTATTARPAPNGSGLQRLELTRPKRAVTAGSIDTLARAAAPAIGTAPASALPLSFKPTPVLAAIYLGGCGLGLMWLGLGTWLLHRVVRTARPPEDWLRLTFERLAGPGRLARTRLLVSPNYPRAMSFGVWRPTIVLPAAECGALKSEQLQHVLRHELAHVGQRDAWSNALFNAAFVLLYVHPCFWWLRSRVRLSAELVADEWAALQSTHGDYARELVAFARACRGQALRPAGAAGVLDSSSQFARRMEMLIRREHPLATKSSVKWRLAAAAGTAVFLAILTASIGAPARAQAPAADPADASGSAKKSSGSSLPAPQSAQQRKVLEQLRVQLEQQRAEMVKQSAVLNAEMKNLTTFGLPAKDHQQFDRMREEMARQNAALRAQLDNAQSFASPDEEQLKALKQRHDELTREVEALRATVEAIRAEAEKLKSERVKAQPSLFEQRVRPLLGQLDAVGIETQVRALTSSDAAKERKRGANRQSRAFTFRFASAKDVRDAIIAVLGDEVDTAKLLVDERTNRLLVFGAGDKELEAIDAIIKLLDQPAAKQPVTEYTEPVVPRLATAPQDPSIVEDLYHALSAVQPPPKPRLEPAKSAQTPRKIRDAEKSKWPDFREDFVAPGSQTGIASNTPTDLVALAVAFSDALAQVQEFHGTNRPAKLRQAQRKVQMLRGIIEALRDAKKAQIQLLESRVAIGQSPAENEALIERKATLRALDKILATEEPEKAAP